MARQTRSKVNRSSSKNLKKASKTNSKGRPNPSLDTWVWSFWQNRWDPWSNELRLATRHNQRSGKRKNKYWDRDNPPSEIVLAVCFLTQNDKSSQFWLKKRVSRRKTGFSRIKAKRRSFDTSDDCDRGYIQIHSKKPKAIAPKYK